MSSELTKRILIAAALLFAAHALSYLPIPAINYKAIYTLTQTLPAATGSGTGVLSRTQIGTLGLFPYLSASILVVLVFYFRRFRHGIDDRDVRIEFYTVGLAGVIALLQSYGVAIFLENLGPLPDGNLLVPNPGWGFRCVAMLAMTAGTMLLIWLANLISQKGIGNGVCLIVLSAFLGRMPAGLADFGQKLKSGNWELTEVLLFLMPLVAILFLAALALVVARWSPPVRRNDYDDIFPAPLQLSINAVGTGGLRLAMSVLFIPATVAAFLPDGFPGQRLLENMNKPGMIYWLAFGSLAFLCTYFLTAWAYRPSGLQATLNKFGSHADASSPALFGKEYESKLAQITLPVALGLPLIHLIALALMQNFAFEALSPTILLPLIAIALDGSRQFNLHRQMGAVYVDAKKESLCEECRASVNETDDFCPGCGAIFEKNLQCETHPERAAFAVCVICQKMLCQECDAAASGRHTCAAHSHTEWISGWATAAIFPTRLEAELSQQHLEKLGLSALVLSNTIEPLTGTLGLFTINAVTPFFAYREIGGGRIRLMTPARDLMRAQEYLAEIDEKAEAI